MISTRALAALPALFALACGSTPEAAPGDGEPDVVCTLEARSSFVVTVLDDATGENLAPNATVRVTDGEVSELLSASPEGVYSGGVFERAGSFTVVVSHPDYQQWQRAGVVVEADECHVITEAVTARLTPR